LLYNQLSWTYDLVAWVVSGGLWKKWVFSILPYLKENRILELGFGPGHLQEAGLRKSKNMFGVDLSPNMVAMCSKRLSDANLPMKITRANAMQLPFTSESFQQIIATFPAPYVLLPETLKEINRALQPNGELLIIPTAWSTSKSPITRFFSWLFNLSINTFKDQNEKLAPLLQPLKNTGFEVTHRILDVEKSKVLLIFAVKKH
jgi:ubiquinone/menaquinone biosynthesis C-methylase UbiE